MFENTDKYTKKTSYAKYALLLVCGMLAMYATFGGQTVEVPQDSVVDPMSAV